jgi:WhiB family redox-sensing transcriptional regulator
MLIHTLVMTITNWVDQASCSTSTGRANWYAEEGTIELIAALHICKTKCPVKEECLAHAMENEERHGTWGGTTPRQRLLLTRMRDQHLDVVLAPRRY